MFAVQYGAAPIAGTAVAAGVKNGVGTRVGDGVVPARNLALVRHGKESMQFPPKLQLVWELTLQL